MTDSKNNSIGEFYRSADSTRHSTADDAIRIRSLLPLLEHGQSDSFLDIGCYDGTKTLLLAKFVGARRVCGVDFLLDRLDQARERGIETKAVDLNATTPLPFDGGMFDFVFVGDVIEHVFSPDHLLKEIVRLLRPGGYVILTTPNLASWRNRFVLLLGWQPLMTEVSTRYRVGNPFAPPGIPSGHIRVFAPRAMRELPQKYGLHVEHLGGLVLPGTAVGSIGRISQLIDRLALRVRPTLCDELVVKLRRRDSYGEKAGAAQISISSDNPCRESE
jgi:SAM-dependent methyltransferase